VGRFPLPLQAIMLLAKPGIELLSLGYFLLYRCFCHCHLNAPLLCSPMRLVSTSLIFYYLFKIDNPFSG
jgi:hypothetical protein